MLKVCGSWTCGVSKPLLCFRKSGKIKSIWVSWKMFDVLACICTNWWPLDFWTINSISLQNAVFSHSCQGALLERWTFTFLPAPAYPEANQMERSGTPKFFSASGLHRGTDKSPTIFQGGNCLNFAGDTSVFLCHFLGGMGGLMEGSLNGETNIEWDDVFGSRHANLAATKNEYQMIQSDLSSLPVGGHFTFLRWSQITIAKRSRSQDWQVCSYPKSYPKEWYLLELHQSLQQQVSEEIAIQKQQGPQV